MSGGRTSRRKGDRAERLLVKQFQDVGIAASRVPVSGAAPGEFGGYDISIPFLDRKARIEVKHHGNGFQRLYRWLAPVDMLLVRCDRADPLVVLPFKTLV